MSQGHWEFALVFRCVTDETHVAVGRAIPHQLSVVQVAQYQQDFKFTLFLVSTFLPVVSFLDVHVFLSSACHSNGDLGGVRVRAGARPEVPLVVALCCAGTRCRCMS